MNKMNKYLVSIVKSTDDLKSSIKKAVDLIGGFKKFIKPAETVLLKPNFNTPDPLPAASDPEFLRAVVGLVYKCGAKIVMIGESSTMSLNTRKTMEELGIFDFEKMEKPPRVYVFDERKWVKKDVPDGKYLKSVSLTEFLDRTDRLILLPCLKTHEYAQFTGSLKLSMGFMKPYERVPMHARHLQEKIAELNTLIKPDLIIMDARKCFINRGPTEGELREPGLILASTDRVAIDVEGVKIIQSFKGNSLAEIDPWELAQIKRAVELGIGSTSEKDYKVVKV